MVVGGYQYSLKMFVFEKVRSKRFPWAWSLLQALQAPVFGLGVLLSTVIDTSLGWKTSVYACVGLVIISSVAMLLLDVCKRKRGRSRRGREENKAVVSEAEGEGELALDGLGEEEEYERKNSLPDGDDDFLPALTLMTQQRSVTYGDLVEAHNPNIHPVMTEVRTAGIDKVLTPHFPPTEDTTHPIPVSGPCHSLGIGM